MKKQKIAKNFIFHTLVIFFSTSVLFLLFLTYVTSFDIISDAVRSYAKAAIVLLIVSVSLSLMISLKVIPKLKRHYSFDPLTGVYTRRAGLRVLKKLYDKAKFQYRALSLCLICIDNYMKVSEMLGITVAEQLILGTRDGIHTHIRQTDPIIRIGENCFLIALIDVKAAKAEEIWQRIEKEFLFYNETGIKPFILSSKHVIRQFQFKKDEDVESIVMEILN